MTDTLTDKIKLVIKKVDSIRGTQLNHSKRITALEEKEPEKFRGVTDSDLLNKIATYLGFVKDGKEGSEEESGEGSKEESEGIPVSIVEEVDLIDPATEKELDEIIGED